MGGRQFYLLKSQEYMATVYLYIPVSSSRCQIGLLYIIPSLPALMGGCVEGKCWRGRILRITIKSPDSIDEGGLRGAAMHWNGLLAYSVVWLWRPKAAIVEPGREEARGKCYARP